MLAGNWYIADDSELQARYRLALKLVAHYEEAYIHGDDTAHDLAREIFGYVGDDVEIRPPFRVDYGESVSIGARTFINYNLVALDPARITIGEDCQIGPNVQLLTPIHPIEPQPRREKYEAARPIVIGNNVWLGGGVIVCPGVTIGDDSVIGAGSVVTRDIPSGVVAVGNPARVIRPVVG
ncbi:sugar O-acetyltransferase [Arcanobacterium haemolyticum]|nr:sugar O-acetyltransferase [Arcanobacterium haemolyticum]